MAWVAPASARFAILAIAAGAICSCSLSDEIGPTSLDAGENEGAAVALDGGARDAANDQASPEDAAAEALPPEGATEDAGEPEEGSPPDATPPSEAGDGDVTCKPGGSLVTLDGPITADTTLTCDHVYVVPSMLLVLAPHVLTIQQGTTLYMKTSASVVVAPGAKLVARGTPDQPIVFTSFNSTPGAGDWGAIGIFGQAPGNWGLDLYGDVITQSVPQGADWPGAVYPDGEAILGGGSAIDDDSGILQYVRLEYGGCLSATRPCPPDSIHELLGLYGVGAGTLLDHVDLRQGLEGCVFAEGGTFGMSHVVCQAHGSSGAFDFTRGNQSRAQFLVGQETLKSNGEGIGIKGPKDDNQLEPLTAPTIYNATLCGGGDASTTSGLLLVREPGGLLYDVLTTQFLAGAGMIQGVPTAQGMGLATTQVRSSIFYGNSGANLGYGVPRNNTDMPTWLLNADWMNAASDPGLAGSCLDPDTLQMAPAASLTVNATPPPADGFFDPSATFIGAFRDGSDTWASGNWIVWSQY
ncbi:MAG TPA: hypothetical protein VGI39_28580 [Polyangiaceae bacterium]|jgi:hypothetical protein